MSHAQERGKRIVPIACDGADPSAAPEGLRQLNWIWCRASDDRDAAFAKLTSALDTDLEWARAHTRLLVRAVEWERGRTRACCCAAATSRQAEQELAANAAKEPRRPSCSSATFTRAVAGPRGASGSCSGACCSRSRSPSRSA